jgi:Tat protein secretion system quality control protein TatD with DNase activity
MPLQDQKGKRNSPEFIPHILDILVSLRPESASAIAQTTTANVRALLSI